MEKIVRYLLLAFLIFVIAIIVKKSFFGPKIGSIEVMPANEPIEDQLNELAERYFDAHGFTDIDADRIPAVNVRDLGDGTAAKKWVKHDAAGRAERADEKFRKGLWEGGFVFVGQFASHVATAARATVDQIPRICQRWRPIDLLRAYTISPARSGLASIRPCSICAPMGWRSSGAKFWRMPHNCVI